jgi:heme/copper-type cytochrome/quinol oxidase subunit 2
MSSLEVSDAYFGEGVNEDLFPDTSFDSYLLPENEFNKYSLSAIRLLTVDNHLLLPTNTNIRVIVTAADVLHS